MRRSRYAVSSVMRCRHRALNEEQPCMAYDDATCVGSRADRAHDTIGEALLEHYTFRRIRLCGLCPHLSSLSYGHFVGRSKLERQATWNPKAAVSDLARLPTHGHFRDRISTRVRLRQITCMSRRVSAGFLFLPVMAEDETVQQWVAKSK